MILGKKKCNALGLAVLAFMVGFLVLRDASLPMLKKEATGTHRTGFVSGGYSNAPHMSVDSDDDVSQAFRLSQPAPLQALRQYIESHSQTSLIHQSNRRKFVLGYYQCPYAAGNRIHEFLNALILAMLTNRTLLWKYYDAAACREYDLKDHRGVQLRNCREQNSMEDCDSILRLRDWIPSFDKWALRLNLTTSNVYSVGRQPLRGVLVDTGNWTTKVDKHQVIHFHREVLSLDWSDPLILNSSDIEGSSKTAHSLYALGKSFLYGMLFEHVFDIAREVITSPEILGSIPTSPAGDSAQSQPFTVAVHSRHTDINDDGCNVTRELECLRRLVPSNRSCDVFVMADRDCTLKQLVEQIQFEKGENVAGYPQCTIYVPSHNSNETALRREKHHISEEHGPFAGAEYFADLAMAKSRARDAVVVGTQRGGYLRSSSALLIELIDYNRKMEAWRAAVVSQHHGDASSTSIPDISTCSYESLTIKKRRKRVPPDHFRVAVVPVPDGVE